MATPDIRLKRAYDAPGDDDGLRILVDRLWPRGVSKRKLALDEWFKQVAPSSQLRKWFGHDPDRWQAFVRSYRDELLHGEQHAALCELQELCTQQRVTLIYAARDTAHSHALALKNFLQERNQ